MVIFIFVQIAVLLLLLVCSGFFSSSETILFSLSPLQVRRMVAVKGRKGQFVEELLSDPSSLLSTILIGNIIVNVALASVGYSLASHFSPNHGAQISVLVLTSVLLVFGEIGPKRMGLAHAEELATTYAFVLKFIKMLTTPLRYFLERITVLLKDLMEPHERTFNEDEYETVIDISGEEGLLDKEEWGMMKAVTRLENLRAANVMTPRVDLKGIDLDEDEGRVVYLAKKATRKTMPLYRGQIDNLEGFLDVRKFLLDPTHNLAAAFIEPLYVPESSSLDMVWAQLQRNRCRNAVAVDEYGGVAGLITRGDILEEITGEIYSDMNKSAPVLEEIEPNTWIVDPHFSLEDLNRKLNLNLHAEDSDRLSGWMAEQTGHLPLPDDVIKAQGCCVVVLHTRKHRVTGARITKMKDEEEE